MADILDQVAKHVVLVIAALAALIGGGAFVAIRRSKVVKQNQRIGDRGSGLQAGGDIHIGRDNQGPRP